MNKNNLYLTTAAGLVALVAVAGIGYMTYAQTGNDTAASGLGRGEGMRGWVDDILTDEQKAELEAKRETLEAERDARRQKMSDAVAQGYDAWKAAVITEQGDDAAILDDVTSDEFVKFQEAHGYMAEGQELMEKARTIMEEIGVQGGMGLGKGGIGKGMMGGMGRGGHGMMDWDLNN